MTISGSQLIGKMAVLRSQLAGKILINGFSVLALV